MNKINCNAYVIEIALVRKPPVGPYEPPTVTLLLEAASLREAVGSSDIDDINEALRAVMGRSGYVTLTMESIREGRGK